MVLTPNISFVSNIPILQPKFIANLIITTFLLTYAYMYLGKYVEYAILG